MSTLPRPLKWPPIFPQDNGLVAWYPFDDRSGAVLRDRSGKGNHGTLYGPTWVAGQRGSALSFDGINDYLTIPDIPIFSLASSWSFCYWMKTTDSNIDVLIKYVGGNLILFRIFGDGRYENYVSDGAHVVDLVTTGAVNDGVWRFHVLTYDIVAKTLLYYQNGILEKSGDTTAINLHAMSATTVVGRGDLSGGWLEAIIGEVRIYNRALSAAETKRHAESELMLVRS